MVIFEKCKIEVKNIKDAFVKADPANKDYYEKNYNEYVAKLDAMIKNMKINSLKLLIKTSLLVMQHLRTYAVTLG